MQILNTKIKFLEDRIEEYKKDNERRLKNLEQYIGEGAFLMVNARATTKKSVITLGDIAVLISNMNDNMNDRFEATQAAIAGTRAQITELRQG